MIFNQKAVIMDQRFKGDLVQQSIGDHYQFGVGSQAVA
jgi:hypothetical protein